MSPQLCAGRNRDARRPRNLKRRRLKGIAGITTDIRPRHPAEHNQLNECLAVLSEAARPLTCDEIQERSRDRGHEIRYNNANEVLKRALGLVKRWEMKGSKLRYEVLNPGRAYLRLMTGATAREQAFSDSTNEVET